MSELADLAIEQGMDGDFDELYDEYGDGGDNDCGFSSMCHKPTGPGECPICGSSTVLKSGRNGKFYGCSKFPSCKGSRNCDDHYEHDNQLSSSERPSIAHWKIGDGMNDGDKWIIGDVQYHQLSATDYEIRLYDTHRKYRGSAGPLILKSSLSDARSCT